MTKPDHEPKPQPKQKTATVNSFIVPIRASNGHAPRSEVPHVRGTHVGAHDLRHDHGHQGDAGKREKDPNHEVDRVSAL